MGLLSRFEEKKWFVPALATFVILCLIWIGSWILPSFRGYEPPSLPNTPLDQKAYAIAETLRSEDERFRHIAGHASFDQPNTIVISGDIFDPSAVPVLKKRVAELAGDVQVEYELFTP